MKQLQEMLMSQTKRYAAIVSAVSDRLANAPDGTLNISVSHNQPQFFLKSFKNGRPVRTYLPKTQQEIIRALAQKDYDKKILALAQKRMNQLKYLAAEYRDNEVEQIFMGIHPERQRLVHPVEPTRAQTLLKWQETDYPRKGFSENTPVLLTDRGERVRSKSEKILADYFYRHGIPYHYEKPFVLENFGVIYPDFTFLSPHTGKEIYWEHLGMMDDPVYSEKAIRKILTYQKNGIFLGDRLLLTYETSQTILTTDQIELMVKTYLL